MGLRNVSLDDRYSKESGEVLLSGIQALVRLPLDQRRRDAARGLDTAGFISGYRGSPLSGYDVQLGRAQTWLDEHRIHFAPGLNEQLAADAVWGSQQAGLFRGARHDGVFGLWYGKAPGLDQAIDAIRHANIAGTAAQGGVLLVVGDDHACKSSTWPSQSEFTLVGLEIPVLNPAGVAEVLEFGLLGWELSRLSGSWVGLIALADAMDSTETVQVSPDLPRIVRPEIAIPEGGLGIRLGDDSRDQEFRLREQRVPVFIAFARANDLNPIVFDSPRARLGIVATGKAWLDLQQALSDLGITDEVAAELGLRLWKVGMPWPLDPEKTREFADGLEEILVVEEKRPLIESQIREQLYGWSGTQPRIVGKRDEAESPLLPAIYELDAAQIAVVIDSRLPEGCPTERGHRYLAELEARRHAVLAGPSPVRTPFFCSGCPHNTSTVVPRGSRGMAGIGCHYMVQWMDRSTDTYTQMGGEGVPWIGQAPFTDEPHVFVNLGDGTYFHSGVLAIRASRAAGVNVTYKILWNGAVAMTGGQPLDGELTVPQLTRQLAAEGVATIRVVADDPRKYPRGAGFAPGVKIEPRERLDAVQRELREIPGVTVLVYDQACAAERRRRRRRGLAPDPARRVFINERVCEGCDDCATKSNCLSVEPVDTPLGRKRRIHQSSCNKDESCLQGLCPSFVTVHGGRLRRRSRAGGAGGAGGASDLPLPELPDLGDRTYDVLLTGVGGTGVTTGAALVAMAAHLEGKATAALDMTGLAQKGGGVTSHLRIACDPARIHGPRVPHAGADALIAFDLVVAAGDAARELLSADRTTAVIDTHVAPVAQSVRDGSFEYGGDLLVAAVRGCVSSASTVDATRLTEQLLGEGVSANVFLLGYAFQRGLLPVGLDALERAIELNGAAVESNLEALAWGRIAAHDRKRVEDRVAPPEPERTPQTLDELISHRAAILTAYQSALYAERYRRWVERVRAAESAAAPHSSRLTDAVARSYFKLLAYKDEYEVARLFSDGEFEARLSEAFEGDFRVEYQLAPPLFARRDRETGRLRKRSYGPWMKRGFALLARMKWLRGTPFDPFGYLAERRLERRLIREYEETVATLIDELGSNHLDLAVEIAELPLEIRGYDRVKLDNVERARARRAALLEQLRARRSRTS
ncbi:MAG: indolepyruvate ferredoxin oxidoreductase family protein [Deltaproteobacteria bacterium]|nr:indolepyruvate ferredoxin oxidoreductase family protein [Deltaproteobacteria bacterium]